MDDSIQNKLAVLEGLIKLLPLSGHAVAAARLTNQLTNAQLGLLSARQLGVLTAEAPGAPTFLVLGTMARALPD